MIIWSIPSLGLFINSWRTRQAQITTGWWKVRPDEFAAFAAYGFAWIDFKGRKGLFIVTVSLLAIPLQVALIPLLQLYVLPLSVPVLAAFAIFQFLWTWNDYLIANTMVGSHPDAHPTTILIASLAATSGATNTSCPPPRSSRPSSRS